MTAYDWQKSSYCSAGEACVHVTAGPGTVKLTESGDPSGAILRVTTPAWAALLHSVKETPRRA